MMREDNNGSEQMPVASPCVVCGGRASAAFFFWSEEWSVRRCVSCDFAWVIDGVGTPEDTAFGWDEEIVAESLKRKRMYADRLRRVLKYEPTPRTWLDVGCGGGGMLVAASQSGCSVEGIELSPSAETIAERFGLVIHRASLSDTRLALGRPDYGVVSYFHVLEHVLNPREELALAREKLSRTGVLVVEVPYFDTLAWKLLRTHHRHFYRRHRSYFNKRSLSRLLEETGYIVQSLQRVPYMMSVGWLMSRMQLGGLGRLVPARLRDLSVRVDLGDILMGIAVRR